MSTTPQTALSPVIRPLRGERVPSPGATPQTAPGTASTSMLAAAPSTITSPGDGGATRDAGRARPAPGAAATLLEGPPNGGLRVAAPQTRDRTGGWASRALPAADSSGVELQAATSEAGGVGVDAGEDAPSASCTNCGTPEHQPLRSWCRACYMRWYRAGKPDDGVPPPRIRRYHGEPCAVDGCTEPAQSLTWCRNCYNRWRKAGRPAEGPPPRKAFINLGRDCSVEDCDQPARYRGWCNRCYTRWYTAGRPAEGPPKRHRKANRYLELREDFEFLRDQGIARDEAAARVGVSLPTARKWETAR